MTLKFFGGGPISELASGAIRRYPRLILPIAAAVVLGYGLQAAGVMAHHQAEARLLPSEQPNVWLTSCYNEPASASWAFREIVYFTYFDYKSRNANNALWTMSVEFAGSLFVFGLAACAGRRRNRGLIYAAVAGVLLLGRHMYMLDFLFGLLLAESLAARWPRPCWWWLWLLPVGLVLGDRSGGLLRHLGGPLVVAGVVYGPTWAILLRVRPLVFLGRVSFCLYLFHIPILYSLGCQTYVWLTDGGWGPTVAAWAGGLATLIVSLILAYLGTITVDDGSIRLARWVDTKLFPVATASPLDKTASCV